MSKYFWNILRDVQHAPLPVKLNLPFMSLVLLSSVFSEGPLQKINKLVKDFPLTKTGIFFAVTSSLRSTQHAGFKTQILTNELL